MAAGAKMRSFVSYGEFTKRQSLYIVPLCLRTHVIVTGEQCKVPLAVLKEA